MHALPAFESEPENASLMVYLDLIGRLERLHRLLLDVVKDEFERLGIIDLSPVQALLLFNVGAQEVTAGELKSRGYYQGSNVSYNLKKLVENGYMHHHKCEVDRRSVRVRLTGEGWKIRELMAEMFTRHAQRVAALPQNMRDISDLNTILGGVERYWGEQIRYIY